MTRFCRTADSSFPACLPAGCTSRFGRGGIEVVRSLGWGAECQRDPDFENQAQGWRALTVDGDASMGMLRASTVAAGRAQSDERLPIKLPCATCPSEEERAPVS